MTYVVMAHVYIHIFYGLYSYGLYSGCIFMKKMAIGWACLDQLLRHVGLIRLGRFGRLLGLHMHVLVSVCMQAMHGCAHPCIHCIHTLPSWQTCKLLCRHVGVWACGCGHVQESSRTCACVCVCMRARACAHACMHTFVCVCVCMHMCAHACVCACMPACVCACVPACVRAHVHAGRHAAGRPGGRAGGRVGGHVCMRVCIHVCRHAGMCACRQAGRQQAGRRVVSFVGGVGGNSTGAVNMSAWIPQSQS